MNALGLSVGAAAKLSMIITKWEKPCCRRFKLNTDGCAKGDLGQSGGGNLLRNHEGKFMWAMADVYDCQTNMVAEARSVMQGIYCWGM